MLDGKPTQAGVSALTRATVGIINKNLFETFIRPYPKAVEQLALTLCGRVRWALSLEYSRIGKSAEQRIAAVLQLLAQRNGTSLPDGRRINASLTQADIASYALTTRESVSRFLSKAGKEGLLKTQNRHIILASSFFKNTFCDSRH
jgi:CRP-like cAMP-binding protein